MDKRESIFEALKQVLYPGFSKDIVTFGAVEDVDVTPSAISVKLKTISADEAVLNAMTEQIRKAVAPHAGNAEIHVFYGGAPHEGTPAESDNGTPFVKGALPGVKRIVPVISGKGGVGKSTVAVNLASALLRSGKKVGLLDLDIFGPSVHVMLGIKQRLTAEDSQIIPAQADGLKVISIGMAVDDDEALILRGPMVMKVLNQLIDQVKWGELDYLIVDMPPGTGDVPLSLTQKLSITGAIVVTTPQDISLIDVRRGVTMLQQVNAHVLGIVENMSHYVCENCGDTAHIFGKGGGQKEAERIGADLLAQIPLVKSICENADKGSPIVDPEKSPELAKIFAELAQVVAKKCDEAPGPVPMEEDHSAHTHSGGG
ncbi:Scaffold protein for [hydrothermal vent metagenome]|uniref:Scaffold protein for n=1 Tax=hydrothermal vent metagenome TaxID=652676 RepID=A0A3B1CI57_9ZZZZ